MKTIKITFILVVIIASFTSCTKEDLHEDDLLINESSRTIYVGGGLEER